MTAEQEDDPFSDICDVCGRRVSREVHFDLVRDSSAIHPEEPSQDGKRLLTVCCAEHLEALREEYRRRPFVEEELWTGKIERALREHPEGLTRGRLSEVTGLHPDDVERAMAWNNDRLQRLREGFDEGRGGGAGA
ncbi:hypothetical protein [Streptomyces sp. ODS28]|uniref:hypothetical protein n=1 Tax=Streptomyces sp. ODS28 TaxID=3136688 RepID=UPI0031EB1705